MSKSETIDKNKLIKKINTLEEHIKELDKTNDSEKNFENDNYIETIKKTIKQTSKIKDILRENEIILTIKEIQKYNQFIKKQEEEDIDITKKELKKLDKKLNELLDINTSKKNVTTISQNIEKLKKNNSKLSTKTTDILEKLKKKCLKGKCDVLKEKSQINEILNNYYELVSRIEKIKNIKTYDEKYIKNLETKKKNT